MSGQRVTIQVDDRQLTVSNLDKVLYPKTGFTKGQVIEHYREIAPQLLPRLRDRPATLIRFPDGVDGGSFYEKNVSRHAPEWVRTAKLVSGARGDGNAINHHVLINDLPTLVWAANLAALELHVPQWTVNADGGRNTPDLLVFDLDPGPPATIVECCRVALLLREKLSDAGLRVHPKTSGSKGMQLYCAVHTDEPEQTSSFAKALARELAGEHPELILAHMSKADRDGRVFIDWSQNNPAKTTVAAYSLRAKEAPTVSTPVTWDEVADCRSVDDLVFTSTDIPERLSRHGDLLAELETDPHVPLAEAAPATTRDR